MNGSVTVSVKITSLVMVLSPALSSTLALIGMAYTPDVAVGALKVTSAMQSNSPLVPQEPVDVANVTMMPEGK